MRIVFTYLLLTLYFSGIAQEQFNIRGTPQKRAHTYAQNSALSSGTWYKLKVKNDGIYKITYDDLVQLGINVSSIDPRNIRLYGNGNGMLPESNSLPNYDDLNENAIYVEGESDGKFDPGDYILFYGESPVVWNYDTINKMFTHLTNYYSDETCYFLTIGNSPGKRIQLQNSLITIPNTIVTKYNDYQYHELDTVNLLNSGKDWYGEYFDATNNYTWDFIFPNIDINSQVKIKTNIAARNTISTAFTVSSSGSTDSVNVSAIPGSSTSDFARNAEDTLICKPGGQNIQLTISKLTPSSIGWLNFIDINTLSNLNFISPQINFRNLSCVGIGNISEFKLNNANSSVKIWDISHPFDIKDQIYSLNASSINFTVNTDSLKQFVAFDGSAFLVPIFDGQIQNQNLHALGQPDMIIISYPDFIQQANRLANIHMTHDNFNVSVVTPQEIYNEFSSGSQDIAAIRNFIRMFYDRASSQNEKPKYLLMFGDGSYDYKNHLSTCTNLVPTYESFNSLTPTASYVTDDFFGILDSTGGYYSNGTLELGIGRFPAKTLSEAKTLVDKVEDYIDNKSSYTENNGCTTFTKQITGDWRNIICFVADDEDNNLHLGQADELASYADTANNNLNIQKIYLDAYNQVTGSNGDSYPDVNKAINKRVADGALIISYTGHGGETGWTDEKVLQLSDINSWTNITNMPVFLTATCEFSKFDNPALISAGERVLLNPNGGGIALFTTTRVAFSNSNFNLAKSFCKFALKKYNGEYYRLGDLIRLAKVDNSCIVNIRNFVLLGDPALMLSYPKYKVTTTEINGHPALSDIDTLKSLSKVTVSGVILDNSGDTLTNFNGKIYPTIYDKKYIATTLGNDPTSIPVNFYQQDHILFKGIDTVNKGKFTFSFIVPKDIIESYGIGRISYYAKMDSANDATGYFENANIIIGGVDSTVTSYSSGPKIQLYLNNTSFVAGNTTDNNPLLLAFLEDSCGINYNSCNFGHDITAVLDNNSEQTIILNDYYNTDMNTYKSGKVIYPFINLSEGEHSLMVKAWDVNNNSAEAFTTFTVTQPGSLSLNNIFNYPNPFNDKTNFFFEHNQPCCDLDVEINIYSITGMLVKTIHQNVNSVGSSIVPVEWNGSDNGGYRLNSGTYLYHVKVMTSSGSYIESSNKLIIIR
jgi:hypothetical protein